MGIIYKKTFTKPFPAGATTYQRKPKNGEPKPKDGDELILIAKWENKAGKACEAPVVTTAKGDRRIRVKANTYTAQFNGIDKATGCRHKAAAEQLLKQWENQAEKVSTGIISPAEDAVSKHLSVPLKEHFKRYQDHQELNDTSRGRIKDMQAQLKRVAKDCKFRSLGDLRAEPLEQWLLVQKKNGMSASTRNEYRGSWVSFSNWCIGSQRLLTNPFKSIRVAKRKTDIRRKRRALTDEQADCLLYVALRRPLAEHGRKRIPKPGTDGGRGKGLWEPLTLENIDAACAEARKRMADKPEFIAQREQLGRERMLIYRTMLLTGMRKNESKQVTIGKLLREKGKIYLLLDAADTKNDDPARLQLKDGLGEEIDAWIRDTRPDAGEDTPLFNVPSTLSTALTKDLAVAGIPKADRRGRTIDVHSLRHTFGTNLSRGGVPPRIAMKMMRRKSFRMTMEYYTDEEQLDVEEALDKLPDCQPRTQQRPKISPPFSPDAPLDAPISAKPSAAQTTGGDRKLSAKASEECANIDVSPNIATKKSGPVKFFVSQH